MEPLVHGLRVRGPGSMVFRSQKLRGLRTVAPVAQQRAIGASNTRPKVAPGQARGIAPN